MNFAMIINVYIDVNEGVSNPFDHPTNLNRFNNENTLRATVESINSLNMAKDDSLRMYIIGAATQESREYDFQIRNEIRKCFSDCPYEHFIFTNSDIQSLRRDFNSDFVSGKGYPELRNLGLILSSIMNEEVIIQIDDDEILRPDYINKLKDVLKEHPDKYLFTAPYEKNGTVRILTEDPLPSWKKFSPMDRDMIRFYENSQGLKESLFGFGGNMVIKKEFAELIFYPPEVPRGEDFSMLLASRLIYENGNPHSGLEKGNDIFRAYFLPYKEMTIIHKPPMEAKKDFLKYFENNMNRFIMEWGIFIKQKGLTIEKMDDLSHYIREMIGHKNMEKYLEPIYGELLEVYPSEEIEKIKKRLSIQINRSIENDRWDDYQKNQKLYTETIKRLKTESNRNIIINLASV